MAEPADAPDDAGLGGCAGGLVAFDAFDAAAEVPVGGGCHNTDPGAVEADRRKFEAREAGLTRKSTLFSPLRMRSAAGMIGFSGMRDSMRLLEVSQGRASNWLRSS